MTTGLNAQAKQDLAPSILLGQKLHDFHVHGKRNIANLGHVAATGMLI